MWQGVSNGGPVVERIRQVLLKCKPCRCAYLPFVHGGRSLRVLDRRARASPEPRTTPGHINPTGSIQADGTRNVVDLTLIAMSNRPLLDTRSAVLDRVEVIHQIRSTAPSRHMNIARLVDGKIERNVGRVAWSVVSGNPLLDSRRTVLDRPVIGAVVDLEKGIARDHDVS